MHVKCSFQVPAVVWAVGIRVHEHDLSICMYRPTICVPTDPTRQTTQVSLYDDTSNSITECIKLHHKRQHCACCIQSRRALLAEIKLFLPLLSNRGFSTIGNVCHVVSEIRWIDAHEPQTLASPDDERLSNRRLWRSSTAMHTCFSNDSGCVELIINSSILLTRNRSCLRPRIASKNQAHQA
jgi:hypothetical protein